MEYMLFPNKYKEWILELTILPSIGENRCIQEIGKENVLQGKIWHKLSRANKWWSSRMKRLMLAKMLESSPSVPWMMDWICRKRY